MKNTLKFLMILLFVGCCPDNDLPQEEILLRSHFNTDDNLLTVNDIRYFNAICDREVISNSGICIYVLDTHQISIETNEYIFLGLKNLYPPGEYEIIDNEIIINFVTDISSRVSYFDLKVIED